MSVLRILLSSARSRRGSVSSLSSFLFYKFQNVECLPTRLIPSCAFDLRNSKSSSNRLCFSSVSTNSNHDQFERGKDGSDLSFSSFRKYLAYNPEFISIDENGRRIFISDSYNNRIIITNVNGKILDYIGDSNPGFEDGEFEFAKLSFPASSYYCDISDSLYFVDSENNGIRRADLQNRTVETIYPKCIEKRASTWNWILNKLGLGNEKINNNNNIKSQDSETGFNASEIESPWHLIELNNDDNNNLVFVIDRKFEVSWVLDVENGSIKEIIKERASIMDLCEDIIKERVSLLKNIYPNYNLNLENDQNALSLFSSVASFENHIIFRESDGKRIMRYNLDSKSISCIQISNFGALGLPHWIICPLERVYTNNSVHKGEEHIHSVKVLPGKCDIRVFINIPIGTEMASKLEENNIWRQIRGSASEIFQSENQVSDQEKVGVAQQWFDELDNLAFTQKEDGNSNDNNNDEENLIISDINNNNNDINNNVFFNCSLNISPGTCEVVVSAALYLKISKQCDNPDEMKSSILRILDTGILNPEFRKPGFQILNFDESLKDLVFVKPLRLRIKVECGDHPTAEKINEIISTDSSLSINVSL
ncbi:hypothetical protein LUZ60_007830 [Juncus effusus]|nr:hypothetical protein LUZ60_007830 [Juncus effusus]